MLARSIILLIGWTTLTSSARGQIQQAIECTVDLQDAPVLKGKLKGAVFDPLLMAEFQSQLLFWDIRPASPKRPFILDVRFSEKSEAPYRRLMISIELSKPGAGAPFHSADLDVFGAGEYSDVCLHVGEELAHQIAKKAGKVFGKHLIVGLKEFSENIPVGKGVHRVLGDRIVVPLDWDRLKAVSRSIFSVQVNGTAQKFECEEKAVTIKGKSFLVLKICPPPNQGPPNVAQYTYITLVKRLPSVMIEEDTEVLSD